MGGSFESGAGDDPNDLFAGEEDDDETEAADQEAQAHDSSDVRTAPRSESEESGESEEIEGTADREVPTDSEGATGSSSAMLDVESTGEIDAARLAAEFVPENYEKPHAWALGRDGVNDGRSEKKTFFLQSSVLDLESECSREVNEILDGDVPLTDLRELALILAYHQPELLAEAAREWGAESA